MTVWPSGLRRWLQAPVRKGVGSNPTAVICDIRRSYIDLFHTRPKPRGAFAQLSGKERNMVPRGLEPRTLRLLAVRSNQLSYETSEGQSARSPDQSRTNRFGYIGEEPARAIGAAEHDTVSERLRRWTRNPLGSARRGSNPLGVVLVRIFTDIFFGTKPFERGVRSEIHAQNPL